MSENGEGCWRRARAQAGLGPSVRDSTPLLALACRYDESRGAIHEYIAWLDREAIDCIESGEPARFREYLAATRNTICGRHPIAILLEACTRTRRRLRVEFETYAQSSRVVTTAGSSVSYASAAVYLADEASPCDPASDPAGVPRSSASG